LDFDTVGYAFESDKVGTLLLYDISFDTDSRENQVALLLSF
jgi:hypothetical protein